MSRSREHGSFGGPYATDPPFRSPEPSAARYLPAAEDLRRMLPDVADRIHAQLSELSVRPTLDGCDRAVSSLAGAQAAVRTFREALEREGGAGG